MVSETNTLGDKETVTHSVVKAGRRRRVGKRASSAARDRRRERNRAAKKEKRKEKKARHDAPTRTCRSSERDRRH